MAEAKDGRLIWRGGTAQINTRESALHGRCVKKPLILSTA
jgi:hypothetical protein